MPFRLGPWEIGLILVIILIVFGVGKLPHIGGAIGKGLRSFRQGQAGEEFEGEEPQKPKKRSSEKVRKSDRKREATLAKAGRCRSLSQPSFCDPVYPVHPVKVVVFPGRSIE